MDWQAKLAWAEAEHERRLAAAVGPDEREDLRLAGIAGASWAAGLAALMLGRDDEARDRLLRAADEYDTSWHAAPPGSWGRPIAMIRCRLMAGDHEGARADASAAVAAGVLDAPGPIGGYCAALALLALGRDEDAEIVAARVADEGLEPASVADALGALARADGAAYAGAGVAPCCGRSRSATRSSRTSASPTRCSSSTRSRPLVASNCRRCRPRCCRASRSPRRARGRGSSPPGWR